MVQVYSVSLYLLSFPLREERMKVHVDCWANVWELASGVVIASSRTGDTNKELPPVNDTRKRLAKIEGEHPNPDHLSTLPEVRFASLCRHLPEAQGARV